MKQPPPHWVNGRPHVLAYIRANRDSLTWKTFPHVLELYPARSERNKHFHRRDIEVRSIREAVAFARAAYPKSNIWFDNRGKQVDERDYIARDAVYYYDAPKY